MESVRDIIERMRQGMISDGPIQSQQKWLAQDKKTLQKTSLRTPSLSTTLRGQSVTLKVCGGSNCRGPVNPFGDGDGDTCGSLCRSRVSYITEAKTEFLREYMSTIQRPPRGLFNDTGTRSVTSCTLCPSYSDSSVGAESRRTSPTSTLCSVQLTNNFGMLIPEAVLHTS